MGSIRSELRRQRERRETEWRQWAEAAADTLVHLPAEQRVDRLRELQQDLTEDAWYRVVNSLRQANGVAAGPPDDGAARTWANGDGAAPAPTGGQFESRAPEHAPEVAWTPPRPEADKSDEPDEFEPRGEPRRRRERASSYLYDGLVGVITLALVLAAVWWLLSEQIS